MFIAQTGTQSAPSTNADSQGTLAFSWWLLPLAVAVFGIALYLRTRKAPPKPSSLSKAANSKERRRGSTTSNVSVADANPGVNPNLAMPRASGQNKKKKEKGKGKRKNNSSVSGKSESLVVTQEERRQVEPIASVPASFVATASYTAPTIVESKLSNAIFEPLRDARKGRSKSSVDFTPRDSSGEMISRPKEVESLFGGKFERAVPKPNLRSIANRWPQPSTQSPQTKTVAATKQPPAVPIEEPISGPPSNLLPLAPAKGLTSFVSKVKSSPAPSSEDSPHSES